MRLETKVGVFVISGILMLFVLSTQVTNFKFSDNKGYPIVVKLPDVNGLEKNAKVKSRGITIGTVQDFILHPSNVDVKILVFNNIKIPKNSIASIKQESMLGVKYLDIEFTQDSEMLAKNDVLNKNKTLASFDQTSDSINKAAIKLDKFIDRLDKLIAQNEENFTKLITNFKEVGDEFKQTGKDINKKLPSILDKFESVGKEFEITGKTINKKLPSILDKFNGVGKEFNQTGVTINEKLPTLINKFEKLEDGIQGIVDDNKDNLKSAIKNIDDAFVGVKGASKKVESSFDKLDKYLASTTQSTLNVNMNVENMQKDHYNKAHFGFDYSPKPTIHYLVDLISTDDYRDDGTGKPVTTKLHQDGRNMVSAQYGKDFNNLRLRAGIIESTGGLGIDYFTYHRKLKLSLEAYDFNAYNDVRGDSAHLKAQLEYTMKKHILLYTGYDNFLNNDARTVYFGFGVRFYDEDLKYLLGSSASAIK